MKKKRRSTNRINSMIDELGLDPDLYDETGFPIPWTDPESGALMGGDPSLFTAEGTVQVVGTTEQLASGKEPTLREMTLDDIEDDCPICKLNRDRIEAGDAPMVYAFD
jgi:hypothetical protein